MSVLRNDNNFVKLMIGLYFTIASVEVTAELFSFKPILFIFEPLMSLVLMILYWITSSQKSLLFFATLFFLLLSNLLFYQNTEKMQYFGIIVFLMHQSLVIIYIIKLTALRDYVPSFIAITPFLFVFFYLFSVSNEIPKDSYYFLIVQNILVSVIGALTLSDYTMNDNKKNPWLLIFGLLTVGLYFIVFIEKYYLSDLALSIFKILGMVLNTAVYYAFYKFVIEFEKPSIVAESLNDN